MAGKTRVSVKTKKLRGKAIVRGGAGTATRTVGLLGGILTYAVEAGIIESNPAHGIRKPKDNVRKRRLSEAEYRILGRMLRDAAKQEKYTTIVDIIRQLALTGCRRSEMIGLKWTEADTEASCLRLEDSKEGESIRPIGLPVVEYLERRRTDDVGTYVFPGQRIRQLPEPLEAALRGLAAVRCDAERPTSQLREYRQRSWLYRSNHRDPGRPCQRLGNKQIHPTLDTALIMAADTISAYIQGLLDGVEFEQTVYALDRDSRKAALARFLKRASGGDPGAIEEERHLAA